MDAALWDQLNTLVADALDQPESTRQSFLERHAPSEALLAEARELLAAHAAADAADAFASPFTDAPVPEQIGPWRPTVRLGAGGMGVVYAADRDDASFEQRVALKLVRPGFGTDFRDRFLRERRVLAGLNHPGIARLLDGGLTADGLPYLAMELVDGEPITTYARKHQLDVGERIGLFRQACDAIAHAHRHLVVHRDLKPAHILVCEDDGGGRRVKLLDFGIAKLLDADDELTKTAAGPMTPQYAAPEQITGGTVTTASDVYALGLVLYELLADQRPYELSGLTASEAEAVITRSTPAPPSAVGDDATDLGRLRRDLDTIVLKALAKEPERRYASAEAFSDDLGRSLDGLPVRARPDTWAYRASRFARRHRVGLAAGAVALAAVLGGAGISVWQAREAASERDRAEAALAQARGTLDYLESSILMGDPQASEADPLLSAVLDSAAARVDLETDPSVGAAVHRVLASVYLGRGDTDAARYHASRAVDGLGASRGLDYATAQTYWAQALADGGDPEGALAHHEAAFAVLDAPDVGDSERASVLNTYGATLHALGQDDDAERQYRRAIAAARRAGDASTEATTLHNLGSLMIQADRIDEALPLYRDVVAAWRRADDASSSYGLPFALVNYANALSSDDQSAEALPVYRKAVQAFADRLGPDHPEAIASRISTAFHLHKMGRFGEARRLAEQSLADAEAAMPSDHPYVGYAQNVAGTTLCDGGDPSRGARLLRVSLDARRTSFPAGHWVLANGESLLGACLARLGQREQARTLLTQSLGTLTESLGDDHTRTEQARARLATFERNGP